jgi:hypothetical protein
LTPNQTPQFETHGIEHFSRIDPADYVATVETLKHHTTRRDKATGGKLGGFGIEREFHDDICDGDVIREFAPELFDLYDRVQEILQARLPDHVVNKSPWQTSALTLKSYNHIGDEHGWHVETNGLTVVCALEGHGRLHVQFPAGVCPDDTDEDSVELVYETGNLYMLRGHEPDYDYSRAIWHRVPPVLASDLPRTTLVMNFYLDGDFTRPAGIDKQHYA